MHYVVGNAVNIIRVVYCNIFPPSVYRKHCILNTLIASLNAYNVDYDQIHPLVAPQRHVVPNVGGTTPSPLPRDHLIPCSIVFTCPYMRSISGRRHVQQLLYAQLQYKFINTAYMRIQLLTRTNLVWAYIAIDNCSPQGFIFDPRN